MLTEEQKELLKKYNIQFEDVSINKLLESLDEEMLRHLDKDYEPTAIYLQLEKLYDSILDINQK